MSERAVRRGLAVILVACAPAVAGAQGPCIKPQEPYPHEPPSNDPELRAAINEQYQDYITKAEDYLSCLEDERARTIERMREIVQRWTRFFGDEAATQSEAGQPEHP